ncbi:MAG TPA: response regulator transcription factor [Anaeromyxobacter sp.]|nr:response regulator transcription factor [Anaeromyxobacter sp.]
MEPLPVLVVSADPLARSGLAALVAARPELVLCGEAGPREAAVVAARRAPRAVLWDLGGALRPGRGAEALRQALEGGLGAPAVALAGDVEQAGAALRAGARGVLSRGAPPDLLAEAIACAARGLLVLDVELAGGFVRAPEVAEEAEPLTPREREVLALLGEGLANKAIAARLGISEHTAKFHVNALLAKLGAESRAEAIVRAARLGLLVL